MAIEFNDANFAAEVTESDQLVVVDFWAPWCGPCKMIGPIIDELASEYDGKVKIGKMNVDENEETPMSYGIMGIPAIKFFKGGKIVTEFTGVQGKDTLKAAIDEHM